MKKTLSVVAAHPDDEVLGCGGSISKYVSDGYEVNVLILADGVSSRNIKNNNLNERNNAAVKANKILGVKNLEILNLPDNSLDTVPFLDIVKYIETFFKKYPPQVVMTHFSCDLNIDHEITNKAVITASRPLPATSIEKLLFFEILSSTEWNFDNTRNNFSPNYFINIENSFNKKISALKAYSEEMREFPHPRSYVAVEALSKLRGSTVGLKSAEAFKLGREIIN